MLTTRVCGCVAVCGGCGAGCTGKRKRKSRRGQAAKRTAAGAGTGAGAGDAQALPPRQAATAAQAAANIRVSQADMLVEPSVIIAAAGPRQGSPGALHSGFGKEAEEDDGGSAMSSGSNTDSSDTASRVGLWGDVTSSDSSDAGDSVSVGHGQDLFHDIFDVELNYSLTDLPLFGAAPGSADAEKATTARRDRGTSSESDRSDDPSFQFGMDSMPVLNKPAAQPDVASTTMSREQFESLVAVQSCALVPSVDGGSEIPLDRASVSAVAPAGEYNVRLTLSGVAATDCLVSAMVVELPTDLSHEDGSGLPPVPQRVVWDADAATPRNFKVRACCRFTAVHSPAYNSWSSGVAGNSVPGDCGGHRYHIVLVCDHGQAPPKACCGSLCDADRRYEVQHLRRDESQRCADAPCRGLL